MLVAANDPFVADLFSDVLRAVLDSRVAADDLVLQFQLEVTCLTTLPDDERVALGRVALGRLPGDRPILDRPELRVAIPVLQRLAVKDRLEAILCRASRPGIRGANQTGGSQRDERHSDTTADVLIQLLPKETENLIRREGIKITNINK